MKYKFEKDDASFPASAYRVDSYPGVAFWVWGWEVEPIAPEPDEYGFYFEDETEYRRTGMVVMTMVGEDRRYLFEPDEITPIEEGDYCSGRGHGAPRRRRC